jgi:hypothetical protein
LGNGKSLKLNNFKINIKAFKKINVRIEGIKP